MSRVVVLGSTNTDMIVRLPELPAPGQTRLGGTFATSPGGKGANQALAARRAGAQVVFLTAVGDDEHGRRALERYRGEGIDVSHARTIAGVASGVALIFVAESGENMIGVAPGANLRLSPEDIDRLPASVFAPGSIFLASLEVPLETVARGLQRARGAGMTTVLNPAPADTALLGLDVLHLVDYLTPNRVEVRLLAGRSPLVTQDGAWRAAEDLVAMGVPHVVVTLGDEGSLLVVRSGLPRFVKTFPVVTVDTIGAGDAYNGVLAVALAEKVPVIDAMRRASAAAALTVTQPGAQSALPDRAAIDRLLSQAGADPSL